MSEFEVRLGDIFYVPYVRDNAIVIAAESGYICLNKSVQDTFNSGRDITSYIGIRYLGNILDIYSTAMDGKVWYNLPEIDRNNISKWEGIDKS